MWITLGCPSYLKLQEQLQPDVYGRVPHDDLIKKWASENRWGERRDEINGQASIVIQTELVNQTVQMWREHAEAAAKVRRSALAYIEENGFDGSASAIQALKWAQEEERKTRGAEAFITQVKNSSNEDLLDTIRGLLDRQNSTEGIIDAPTSAEPDNP